MYKSLLDLIGSVGGVSGALSPSLLWSRPPRPGLLFALTLLLRAEIMASLWGFEKQWDLSILLQKSKAF